MERRARSIHHLRKYNSNTRPQHPPRAQVQLQDTRELKTQVEGGRH